MNKRFVAATAQTTWKSTERQREFLDRLVEKYNIRTQEDWAQITTKIIRQEGGRGLLGIYPDFLSMLEQVYPEIQWNPIKVRKTIPNSFWESPENQRQWINEKTQQLQFSSLDDWLHVTKKQFSRLGGAHLLELYPSVQEMLKTLFDHTCKLPRALNLNSNTNPEEPSKSKMAPRKYWANPENQRRFLEEYARAHQLNSFEDWSKITAKQFRKTGGSEILKYYPSFYDLLKTHFPEYSAAAVANTPGKLRARYPSNYWKSTESHRDFLDSIAKLYHIVTPKDWRKITWSTLTKHGGDVLLKTYGSFIVMLRKVYPEQVWDEFECRPQLPQRYWNDTKNQRAWLDKFAQRHNIHQPGDWAKVTSITVQREGGTFLGRYPSFFKMLETLYPEHSWNIFTDLACVSFRFWAKKENQRAFLDYFAKRFNIAIPEGWTKVTWREFEKNGGGTILNYYPSFFMMLETLYPEYQWNIFDHKTVSSNFWKDPHNQKKFLDHYFGLSNFGSLSDWKQITTAEILKTPKGYSFLKQGSLFDLLNSYYRLTNDADQELDVFDIRKRVPANYWKSLENQRKFLDSVAEKFGFAPSSESGWARVTWDDVAKAGGASLMGYYENFHEMLSTVYPECKWDIFTCRKIVPTTYWRERSNHREFFDRFARQHSLYKPTDWKFIKRSDVARSGGCPLLTRYPSFFDALKSVYSEYYWDVFDTRQCVPSKYWMETGNQVDYFERIAQSKGLVTAYDWWKVTRKDFGARGQSIFRYRASILSCLERFYPSVNWKLVFSSKKLVPEYLWSDPQFVAAYLRYLQHKYHIQPDKVIAELPQYHAKLLKQSGFLYHFPTLQEAAKYAGDSVPLLQGSK